MPQNRHQPGLLPLLLTALLCLITITACVSPMPLSTVTRELTSTATPASTLTASATARPTSTDTPTPTPTATLTPTTTPTRTPAPTPTITPTPTPLPASALLEPTNHQAQTLNNCGPASVAILLGYYDHWITQQDVNAGLSVFPLPCQVASYIAASDYGLLARAYRFPTTRERQLRPVRHLLANGIPVIVLQRLESDSRISHYRVFHSYDDAIAEFTTDDPLLGTGYTIPYDTFTELLLYSRPTAAFIPVYPPDLDAQVQADMRALGAFAWGSSLCD